MKIVLANPATRVTTSNARSRPVGNHCTTAANGRLVERRRHGEPHERPDGVQRGGRLDLRPGEGQHGRQARAERHQQSRAAAVEPPSDRHPREARCSCRPWNETSGRPASAVTGGVLGRPRGRGPPRGVPVGRWLDRRGARLLMTLGSCLTTVLAFAWSQVETAAALYAVWTLMGLAMAATLYEPAFAAVVQWFPTGRERAFARGDPGRRVREHDLSCRSKHGCSRRWDGVRRSSSCRWSSPSRPFLFTRCYFGRRRISQVAVAQHVPIALR